LFIEVKDGTIISFELEAYIVRNMKVPLLLREDFQTMYELRVFHHASGHSKVFVGKTGHTIAVSSAQGVDVGFDIRQAYLSQPFVRRKTLQHCKVKARDTEFLPRVLLLLQTP
jgi:hypothetical protein